ncbi:hypothetical protein DFH94DRAFT_718040 [Russula ochroleuca]|uniref:JmjC domain-containing protein n=1 Tax=Russula ochroleuca TaxID=152965 RepID=A0A9P5N2S9_9AGAM|nr:hypothetical protein DFH94DRAFT_718040 [Russula ochroleuca]
MNGSVHDPHAHKRTSINELLNPIASSAIDHGLSHQPSPYSNGHYAQSTTYTHPPMPPPPHHRTPNGTAYKLNPASWDGADHDRQRVDHMHSPRGFAPPGAVPPGAYQGYHAHLSQTHEDGFSEPSAWPSPAGRMEALPAYASPTITQSSYSDERTSIPNDLSATAGSSPYPSRPDSATYIRPEFAPSVYSQRPPQPTAVFGAWPHHARPPGVPPTRGLTEHPHPQHAHLPPHYLSHPAFYQPVHPSMLYPYMAPHPYPPPAAPLPESPSRKRAGPEETQTSRSKRKRVNARDTVESNGSRRGYTANKRNQAAQIAAHNAQLQAFTPGSGPNASDSRASATDRPSRTGNENSSGGADGNGPFHPELQFARCMSNRYKAESFPRCVSCTRRWAGDTCRFQGIRFFLKDEKQNIVGVSFVENQKADSPTMKFPTRWNRPLDTVFIKEIKLTVARALLPTLKEEQEHLRKPEIIRRPRDSDVRATCDTCMTSIFSSSWMCRLCGREACSECFAKVRELTQYRTGASDSEIAALQAKRESHAHTNPFFLSCTRRNEHQFSDFSPMSRFDKAELEGVIESMEKLLQEETVPVGSEPAAVSSNKDGTAGVPEPNTSPFVVARKSGVSTRPAVSSPPPVQTSPLNGTALNEHAAVEDPSGIPSHSTMTYTTTELTDTEFRRVWPQGAPLVVTGVGEKFGIRWRPEHFREKHGSQTCSMVECQTDASKRITVGEFFGYFGKYEGRTDHWKLKDWPSSSDFKAALPDLYEEFQKGVPMPNYSRRDGVLNIASHFPSNTVMPDLGPKMYIALATTDEEGSKGSTRLHMDMADGVNIMVYSEARPDGSPGVAAWDLFRAEDADRLRKFLKRRFGVNGQHDPILSQQYYLDAALRKELFDDYGIKSHRVYQRPGDAVFIPAGCAHQVANLADSIKVAVDFVSSKNIARCEKLTGEFREQNQSMVWKEDSLQLRTMMWFAWLSCTRQEEEIED